MKNEGFKTPPKVLSSHGTTSSQYQNNPLIGEGRGCSPLDSHGILSFSARQRNKEKDTKLKAQSSWEFFFDKSTSLEWGSWVNNKNEWQQKNTKTSSKPCLGWKMMFFALFVGCIS